MKFYRARRAQILLLLLSLTLLVAASPVDAARMYCRSDPVVLLSNGATFDLSADIGSWAFQVREVHYTLHGPEGTSLLLAVGTPTWLTSQETFEYVADQAEGEYYAVVTAHTTLGDAPVVANAVVITAEGALLDFYAVEGVEGVPIQVFMQ